MMEVAYGEGTFHEGNKNFEGTIILSEHKLFLRKGNEDITPSYIPLEKIEWIKTTGRRLILQARPTIYLRFVATFTGERGKIKDLAQELISRRGLKKKWLRNMWVEQPT